MYFTSGSDRAFEQLMQTRPGADHFDSGEAGAPEDCGTCRFYRPHWKYQFCVYEECPYQPGKRTALDGAVKFQVKGVDDEMAVFRVEKNRGYTVMSNHHLRNKDLSLKAKGLLSQMLSLPEDWDYTLKGLSLINRESYLLLKIGAEKRYIAKNVIIYTAEQVARMLFSEVSMDVLQMTGNDHTEQTADPLELAEIKRRWNPYIDQLPEYAYICDDLLSGRK